MFLFGYNLKTTLSCLYVYFICNATYLEEMPGCKTTIHHCGSNQKEQLTIYFLICEKYI